MESYRKTWFGLPDPAPEESKTKARNKARTILDKYFKGAGKENSLNILNVKIYCIKQERLCLFNFWGLWRIQLKKNWQIRLQICSILRNASYSSISLEKGIL
jgi:hypothetical protein